MDGTILIVDDVATNRIVLKAKLGAAQYRPIMAATGADALRLTRHEQPDLILLDLLLPDMSGIEVLRRLRADPATRHTPVIVVSSSTSAKDLLEALATGADDVFPKPCDDSVLLARVRNLLRRHQDRQENWDQQETQIYGLAEDSQHFAHPGLIALVTDRKDFALRLRRELGALVRDRFVVIPPARALEDIEPNHPVADVYVLDAIEGSDDLAHRLLSDLKSRANTRHAGICMMSPHGGASAMAAMAFDLGADDIIRPTMCAQEIAARLRAILRGKLIADKRREQVQTGLRASVIDAVTGLHNRRYGLAKLTALVHQKPQSAHPLTVIVADLDRFKLVNDRHGHATGDQVLVEVGNRLAISLRCQDLLARFGGEEFLIALPDTPLNDAYRIADRLRMALAAHPVLSTQGASIPVTASFGLAVLHDGPQISWEAAEQTALTLIDEADTALLRAKAAGRNQVTLAQNKSVA